MIAIILGGVYAYQRYFNEKEPIFMLEYDETLSYTYYRNYGDNQYLVDNWSLRYCHTNWAEPRI